MELHTEVEVEPMFDLPTGRNDPGQLIVQVGSAFPGTQYSMTSSSKYTSHLRKSHFCWHKNRLISN